MDAHGSKGKQIYRGGLPKGTVKEDTVPEHIRDLPNELRRVAAKYARFPTLATDLQKYAQNLERRLKK